jgi:hypothetical protein
MKKCNRLQLITITPCLFCTQLAAPSDKVYPLLAHDRWFSPGIPAFSTTITGRMDCYKHFFTIFWKFKWRIGYQKYSSLSKINRQWRKWRALANTLHPCQKPGTSKTGFRQVKIIKEFVSELLMYLFSFLSNEILVLIFYISFICKGWPFNSLKCTARRRI